MRKEGLLSWFIRRSPIFPHLLTYPAIALWFGTLIGVEQLLAELKVDIPPWLSPWLVGIGVLVPVGLIWALNSWAKARRLQEKEQERAAYHERMQAAPTPMLPAPRSLLAKLQRTDPAFSITVFEDFFYFLYAEMHRARGAANLEALGPYLSDTARAALRSDERILEVRDIVMGVLTYVDILVSADGAAAVTVTVESSYVERYRGDVQGEQRFFAKEMITLTRAAGSRSRTPDETRTLNCPSGTKDWVITTVLLLGRNTLGSLPVPKQRTETTGLFAFTVTERVPKTAVDPNAQAVVAQIQAEDPTFTWGGLEQRIVRISQEFYARDLAGMRPFLSDNLFQSQLYWADLYRAAGRIHRTDGTRITFLEFANATIDAYYDSVTVRVYSSGADYTTAENGWLLSGSPQPRGHTEYWTLTRSAQSRQFDWILSRIEQDNAYSVS